MEKNELVLLILTFFLSAWFFQWLQNREQKARCDSLTLQGASAYLAEGIISDTCYVTQSDISFTQIPVTE